VDDRASGTQDLWLRSQRGGFSLHAGVVVATLIVLAAVVLVVVRSHQRTQELNRRKATQICEDGLMIALDSLSQSHSWRAGIAKMPRGDGWIEVRVAGVGGSDSTRLRVTARGTSGPIVREQVCTLERHVDKGDTVWVQREVEER
jgi:hypothetical protein